MSPVLSRIVSAVIVGIVTTIVVYVIGYALGSLATEAGALIQKFAAILGLLAGIGYFLSGRTIFHR